MCNTCNPKTCGCAKLTTDCGTVSLPPKPHKHAAVIKAWADGAKVQIKERSGKWVDVDVPGWTTSFEYRVKPTTKRTVGYRRYIYRLSSSNKLYPAHAFDGEDHTVPDYIENRHDFVRWIDTEWQYYEWEE